MPRYGAHKDSRELGIPNPRWHREIENVGSRTEEGRRPFGWESAPRFCRGTVVVVDGKTENNVPFVVKQRPAPDRHAGRCDQDPEGLLVERR